MAVEQVPPNGWAPIEIGYKFRMGNSDEAGQWVEIVAVDKKFVYVKGLDNHICDLAIPIWKFDDVVSDKTVTADVGSQQGIMGFSG